MDLDDLKVFGFALVRYYNNLFIALSALSFMSETLNKGFSIPREEYFKRIGMELNIPLEYSHLVPPKKLAKADQILILKTDEVAAILRAISLVSSPNTRPYASADFSSFSVSPSGLYVPQTFVLEGKLTSLLRSFDRLYEKFQFPRLSQRPAHLILGKDEMGNKRAALYMPPMVELNGEALLIDGNHRGTLCDRVGVGMEVIGIRGSSVRAPYDGKPWKSNIVQEKPELKDRYHNLRPELLKDFDHVGIDG